MKGLEPLRVTSLRFQDVYLTNSDHISKLYFLYIKNNYIIYDINITIIMKKLIFGLGNGDSFCKTKHNIGMEFVKKYIHKINLKFEKISNIYIAIKDNLIFAYIDKPEINLSYKYINFLKKKFELDSIYIIFDDIDLENKIKFQPRLVNSTHNGIKGIKTYCDELNKFNSIRIGVGRNFKLDLDEDILSNFILPNQEEYFKLFEEFIKKI